MTTFTKEQLIASAHARIEFAEMMLAGELEPLKERTWSIEFELARIALASLEAEPVAWLLSGGGAKNHVCFDSGNAYADPLREVTALYTAPPAPAMDSEPVAWWTGPEPTPTGEIESIHDHETGSHSIPLYPSRDAMLQGKADVTLAHEGENHPEDKLEMVDHSGDGNSPVIPDGYVLVPIEPTEAMMLHKSGCQHHAWDDQDCVMRQTRRLIWSHMIAAAPQQEVK